MPKQKKDDRFEVSERALIGRVRRALAHEGQYLRVSRSNSSEEANFGRYLICDSHTGNPDCWGDAEALVTWARELKVMHSDERLVVL